MGSFQLLLLEECFGLLWVFLNEPLEYLELVFPLRTTDLY